MRDLACPSGSGSQASPEAHSDLRPSGVDPSRMQWQPIATAPRDGRPIWAYLFDSGIRQVKWLSVEAIMEEEGGDPEDWQEGFYEVEEDDNEWAPRWWMPLEAIPSPPAQRIEARSDEMTDEIAASPVQGGDGGVK